MRTIETDLSGLDAETALETAVAITTAEVDVRMGAERLQLLRAGVSRGDADRVVEFLRAGMAGQLEHVRQELARWLQAEPFHVKRMTH